MEGTKRKNGRMWKIEEKNCRRAGRKELLKGERNEERKVEWREERKNE
jgi:hypothetical protein